MKRVHAHRVTDEELRAELAAKDTILFMGTELNWQEVEHQVERLGFAESYIVSAVKNERWSLSRISVRPR
jgi:hypothetical protein